MCNTLEPSSSHSKKDNDFQYDFSALSEDSSSETDGKTTQDTSIDSIQDESKMEETSGVPSTSSETIRKGCQTTSEEIRVADSLVIPICIKKRER
jgi:hypothetical protein